MKYSVIKIKEFPLKKKRLAKKIGLRTFAKLCGVDYAHLFRLEAGTYIAKEETYKKIIEALKKYDTKSSINK